VAISVLLVDDDPDFLALAIRVCEGMGFEVVGTAHDAASAIATAKETKPQAALIDIGLPDRDGIDLGTELAALPWSPRVVLTSTDSDADSAVERSERAEALPFIPKEDVATEHLRRLLGAE
jgi:DNA-binding NarL/FixJ family response regulator